MFSTTGTAPPGSRSGGMPRPHSAAAAGGFGAGVGAGYGAGAGGFHGVHGSHSVPTSLDVNQSPEEALAVRGSARVPPLFRLSLGGLGALVSSPLPDVIVCCAFPLWTVGDDGRAEADQRAADAAVGVGPQNAPAPAENEVRDLPHCRVTFQLPVFCRCRPIAFFPSVT